MVLTITDDNVDDSLQDVSVWKSGMRLDGGRVRGNGVEDSHGTIDILAHATPYMNQSCPVDTANADVGVSAKSVEGSLHLGNINWLDGSITIQEQLEPRTGQLSKSYAITQRERHTLYVCDVG
jgi:hypothetical protein